MGLTVQNLGRNIFRHDQSLFVKDKHGNELAMHASAKAFANPFERFCSKNRVPDYKTISEQGSNVKALIMNLK